MSTSEIYFVCLNDYVEKILRWENEDYQSQKTTTIQLPATNKLANDAVGLMPLRFYAKRAKYYAAFNKFNYQKHEIGYDKSPEQILHFLNNLARL